MHITKLQHALHYASLGIPVLPLQYIKPDGVCSCGGVEENPKCKPGKHPYGTLVHHGVADATTGLDKLREWFDGKPYNLGIATGAVSGFFALDRDDKDGGDVNHHRPAPQRCAGHPFNALNTHASATKIEQGNQYVSSAYLRSLEKTLPPPASKPKVPPLEERFTTWFNSLPDFARNRPFSMCQRYSNNPQLR